MPRPEPTESQELLLLRLVMFQDQADDDKNDVALGRYRAEINSDFKWVQQRLQIAEREFRAEMKEWHNEVKAEKDEPKQKGKVKDIGTEKCLAKLDKLIGELAGAKR